MRIGGRNRRIADKDGRGGGKRMDEERMEVEEEIGWKRRMEEEEKRRK